MQNLQNYRTALLDPNIESQQELYSLTEQLAGGLPGLPGNTLLLLRLGVPTPTAGIAFPQALQEKMKLQIYLNASPGKHFVRHERPGTDASEVSRFGQSQGGPVYRIRISQLPVPQKHQAIDRLDL